LTIVNEIKPRYKIPKVKTDLEEYQLIALQLQKAYGWSYNDVMNMDGEEVMMTYHYEAFCQKMDYNIQELNKPEGQ